MPKTILLKSRPNGHYLELTRWDDDNGEDPVWIVTEPGDEDGVEFDSAASAQDYYNEARLHWADTPNDAAQARYDEQWGTSNGYAIMPRREY